MRRLAGWQIGNALGEVGVVDDVEIALRTGLARLCEGRVFRVVDERLGGLYGREFD